MTPTHSHTVGWTAVLALLFVVLTPLVAETAATHKHEHSHGGRNSKERLADGSYAARDAHHHDNEVDGDDYVHHNEFDHEAILGSVQTAKEFDELPAAEAKKRLAVLVREMDLNHDGFIDRHELKAWILRSFKRLAEEEAAERMSDVDYDGDGYVTLHEYLKETYELTDTSPDAPSPPVDPVQAPHAAEEAKLIADDRRMFAAADVDGDGRLSGEEFVAFISPEEFAHMLPAILEQTLRDKDANGNGKIEFQEFVGETAAHHDKEWLVTEKDKFDDYDKDEDGLLNGNEILSWVVPSNDDVATDEVDHLFASADDNHDDRLAHKEIIEHSETFVGSEATDFGEQLHELGHIGDEL